MLRNIIAATDVEEIICLWESNSNGQTSVPELDTR